MKYCFFALLISISLLSASAQTLSSEQQLLNLAINRKGRFIYAIPLKLYLAWADTEDVFNRRTGSRLTKQDINPEILTELVRNSYQAASTPWTDIELDSAILISERSAGLTLSPHLKEMSNGNEHLTKFYRKAIRRYNATDSSERDIASFSRPVFDTNRKYALIEFDNGYLLSGGGYIVLYKREEYWREVGIIKRWAH